MAQNAKYAFFPWVRQGLIGAVHEGATVIGGRAELMVKAVVSGSSGGIAAPGSIRLFGPGDITGLDTRQVSRTDPPNLSSNNEPNYFTVVEFDRPDLPWMFSPKVPAGGQLRPWICLIVVEKREGVVLSYQQGQPLQTLDIKTDAYKELPYLPEAWAWAHAQIAMKGDDESNSDRLNDALANARDRTLSRLVCPRKLETRRSYFACVVPTFLGGVQAGLGMPVAAATVLDDAWIVDGTGKKPDSIRLPVYYHWEFSTGAEGDFEALLSKLQRKRLTLQEAGTRKLNISQAGYGLPTSADVDLEGALSPEMDAQTTLIGPSAEYQVRMKDLLNEKAIGVIPVLPPPLYGRWHAAQRAIPDPRPGLAVPRDRPWLKSLSLDPRYRVPASLGAQVVRDQQEQLMASAWNQVGDIEKANQLIRFGQLAKAASTMIFNQRLGGLDATTFLLVTGPAHSRIRYSQVTLKTARGEVSASALPPASISSQFRRLLRPRGKPARWLGLNSLQARSAVIDGMNNGKLRPKPEEWPAPSGMLTTETVVGRSTCGTNVQQLQQSILNDWSPKKLKKIAEALRLAAALVLGSPAMNNQDAKKLINQAFRFLTEAVDLLSKYESSPSTSGSFNPVRDLYAPACLRLLYAIWCFFYALLILVGIRDPFLQILVRGLKTEVEKARLDILAITVGIGICVDGQSFEPCETTKQQENPPLEINDFKVIVYGHLDPAFTISARLSSFISVPGWKPEELETVLVSPDFPAPMYKELAAMSQEWMLPGLERVPANSLVLVESNPRFIEAFMVGLNHEMSRELLWRGYPTDQRGTYFRQFWDPSGRFPAPKTETERADYSEKGKDIPPLHEWLNSNLGENLGKARAVVTGVPVAQIVLLIRGELLQRYPSANIFLVKAVWNSTSKIRDPVISEDDPNNFKYPAFRGELPPDISFLGFQIKGSEAIGNSDIAANQPGWFLAIEQQPTEPRYGLDDAPPQDGAGSWRDLAWTNVAKVDYSNYVLLKGGLSNFPVPAQKLPAEWKWSANSDSAQIASISMQRPVRVYIHASELL